MIKARCPDCKQLLQKSIYDRCMYCGIKLPVELCSTNEEKNKLIKIKSAYDRRRIKEKNEIKNHELEPDLMWDDFTGGFGE